MARDDALARVMRSIAGHAELPGQPGQHHGPEQRRRIGEPSVTTR